MPPKVRFQRDDIINAAYELARKHGLDMINARSVANEIGCSTQPIFRVFENMEQLKTCITKKAAKLFSEFIEENKNCCSSAYQSLGKAYLLFAMNEPNLFNLLFLRNYKDKPSFVSTFSCQDMVIDSLMKDKNFTLEQAKIIYQHMWIFTYGLAAILSTQGLQLTSAELDDMLVTEYRGIASTILCNDIQQINPPV